MSRAARIAAWLSAGLVLLGAAWAANAGVALFVARAAAPKPKYWFAVIGANVNLNQFRLPLQQFKDSVCLDVDGGFDGGASRCVFSKMLPQPSKEDCGPRLTDCEQLEIDWSEDEHPRISLWVDEAVAGQSSRHGQVYPWHTCASGDNLPHCLETETKQMARALHQHDRCCHDPKTPKNCSFQRDEIVCNSQ